METPGRKGTGAVKAVIFDFGNVLCRLDRPAANRAIASHSRLSAEEVDARLWGGDIERDAETGRIDSQGLFRRVREAIGAEASWTYGDFEAEFMRCIQPNPDGEAALIGAAERGLRTFVLSNTSFLHARWLFQNETLATVPELYALSYKLGFMKPDPRCWLWLLERSGLGPGECLYVDDLAAYCAAAEALGLGSIRYDLGSENLLQKLEGVL